jgi:hypothetical protein
METVGLEQARLEGWTDVWFGLRRLQERLISFATKVPTGETLLSLDYGL